MKKTEKKVNIMTYLKCQVSNTGLVILSNTGRPIVFLNYGPNIANSTAVTFEYMIKLKTLAWILTI